MIRRDNEIEQIDLISSFLYAMLFPPNFDVNNFENFEFFENFADLKIKLNDLINQNKFCEAEDLLFDEISKNKSSRFVLQVGVWFFWKLNTFKDEILENNNFPRSEILQGFTEIGEKVDGKFGGS